MEELYEPKVKFELNRTYSYKKDDGSSGEVWVADIWQNPDGFRGMSVIVNKQKQQIVNIKVDKNGVEYTAGQYVKQGESVVKIDKNGLETVVARGGDLMYPLGFTLRATDIINEEQTEEIENTQLSSGLSDEYIKSLLTDLDWKSPEIRQNRIETYFDDVFELMSNDDEDYYYDNCFCDRITAIFGIADDKDIDLSMTEASSMAVLSWFIGEFDIPGATHEERENAIGVNIPEEWWEIFDTFEEMADDTLNHDFRM